MDDHDDFDFGPSPGIPAPLPAGEHVLWQGKPDWRTLARSPFHVRLVGLWFVLLAAVALAPVAFGDATLGAVLPGVIRTLAFGVIAVGILALLAWLTGRVTIYTITSRRVLIQFGIALQVTMNVPFAEVLGADVRHGRDGVGDLPLKVVSTRRIGYAVLWPHVRPWRLSRPEPMLRAVPDVDAVAAILVGAMQASLAASARGGSVPAPIDDGTTIRDGADDARDGSHGGARRGSAPVGAFAGGVS